MTITELSNIIKIPLWKLSPLIKEISKKLPSLASKYYKGNLYPYSHFSQEEMKAICDKLELNELQKLYIKEHIKEGSAPDIYEIHGTHRFLMEYKKNPDIKCCNTCKYLIGITGSHKMPQPYCKVYEKFLVSFKAKVYEDWCTSYLKSNLSKPRQWYNEIAPLDLKSFKYFKT